MQSHGISTDVQQVGGGSSGLQTLAFVASDCSGRWAFDDPSHQFVVRIAYPLHLRRIVRHVSGQMDPAAWFEQVNEPVDDLGSNESPPTLLVLRPGIGKVDADTGERLGRQAIDEDQRVAVHEPKIVDVVLVDLSEQSYDSRSVHVDGDHTDVAMSDRRRRRGFTLAEPDVEDDRHRAREDRRDIEGVAGFIEAERRSHPAESVVARCGYGPAAWFEGAGRPLGRRRQRHERVRLSLVEIEHTISVPDFDRVSGTGARRRVRELSFGSGEPPSSRERLTSIGTP